MLTLPKLIFENQNIEKGNKNGECCVCGEYTEYGFDFPFSENFVGYNNLKYGNVLCEYCFSFFKNQDFRKRSFVATSGKAKFLQKDEIEDILLNPPEPPFFIYVSSTHQKQGWITALKKVSLNKDFYWISTDLFEEPIFVRKDDVYYIDILVNRLREQKITKDEIRTGQFSYNTIIKAKKEGFEELLNKIKKYAYTPILEVIVYVAK